MADLQSCYFCGAGPDAALSEYGVVPAAFEPTDDQQRSVVLCPTCRDKLIAVMDAAVAASDHASSDSRATADQLSEEDLEATIDDIIDATVGPDAGADAGAGANEQTNRAAKSSQPTESTQSAEPNQPAASEQSAANEGRQSDARQSAGADRQPSAETSTTAQGAAEDELERHVGIRRDRRQGVSFNTASQGEDTETDDGTDEKPPERDTGAASVGTAGNVPVKDQTGEELVGSNSENYRQVLRLLQNREFPVQRSEIVDVAASAYELTPSEVESAIDTIVTKGLLVEDDGVLNRT